MKRALTLVTVALLSSLSLPMAAIAESADRFEVTLGERMPALLDKYGVSGSVVSYIEHGDVVWTRAYGMADISSGTPMSPEMVFEFGSLGKVITAWATMRLVEEGSIDLDAPVNTYLEGWEIESSVFDTAGVTARRLLTHTSGLNMHGYMDYSPRRVNPPDAVQSLYGWHLLDGLAETVNTGRFTFGDARLIQEPGSGYLYSGAGYGILQLLIEEVSGESFDSFVKDQVTDPLGATSIRWAWTPELEALAPTPYGDEGQPLEYRQLTIHGIGSEIATVPDFARFVAATVSGPNGEPPGRGVLAQETIELMITPSLEPGAAQGFQQGLGYALGRSAGNRTVWHSGSNTGWMALFILDVVLGQGFVVASPSNRAEPLHSTIVDLWGDVAYGPVVRQEWPPAPGVGESSRLLFAISALMGVVIGVGALRLVVEVKNGRRVRVSRPDRRSSWRVLPWLAATLFGWYTVYSSLPLYLPAWWGDIWPSKGTHSVMLAVIAGLIFSVARLYFPRNPESEIDALAPLAEVSSGGS